MVIAIGYDLVEYSPKNWNRDLKKKIIHIDFTPAEVDTYYPPTVEIAADIEYTINAILEEIRQKEIKRRIQVLDFLDMKFHLFSKKLNRK